MNVSDKVAVKVSLAVLADLPVEQGPWDSWLNSCGYLIPNFLCNMHISAVGPLRDKLRWMAIECIASLLDKIDDQE